MSKNQFENTIKETGLHMRMEGSGRPAVGNEVEKLLQSDKIPGPKHKSQWEVAAGVQTARSTVRKIVKR